MAILGLLLLAAAVVVGVEAGVSNTRDINLEVFGQTYGIPVNVVMLVGALLATVAVLGLFMITGTFQRRRHLRRDAKHRMVREETDARLADTDRTAGELAAENDRLRAELTAERRAAATMGGVAVPPGAGNVAYGDQVSDAVRSDTISDTGRFDPYPADRGTDHVANTDGVRYDGTADTTASEEKAGVIGRFRNSARPSPRQTNAPPDAPGGAFVVVWPGVTRPASCAAARPAGARRRAAGAGRPRSSCRGAGPRRPW